MIVEVGIIRIAMVHARKIVLFSIVFNFRIQDQKYRSIIGKLTLFSQPQTTQ
jgi:hypothetical protein